MWKKLVDWYRKRIVFKHACWFGIDVDGDVLYYKGTPYYINIFRNEFYRV